MKKINTYEIEEEAKAEGRAEASRMAEEGQRLLREDEKSDSTKRLWKLVDKVLKYARKTVKFEDNTTDAINELGKAARANPTLDSGDPVQTMSRFSVTGFSYGGAYAFDFILLGALSGYWIGLVGGSWVLLWIAKIVLPFVVLALEVGVASNFVSAAIERRRVATYGWGLFSTIIVAGVGLYTANMVMANEGFDSLSEMGFGDLGFLGFMMAIAMMPHLILLFSGLAGYEGKALILLYWKRFKVRQNNRKCQKYSDNTRIAFAKFTRAHDEHVEYFSCAKWDLSAVFSADARRVINESMEAEIIPAPSAPPPITNGTPLSATPENEPDALER